MQNRRDLDIGMVTARGRTVAQGVGYTSSLQELFSGVAILVVNKISVTSDRYLALLEPRELRVISFTSLWSFTMLRSVMMASFFVLLIVSKLTAQTEEETVKFIKERALYKFYGPPDWLSYKESLSIGGQSGKKNLSFSKEWHKRDDSGPVKCAYYYVDVQDLDPHEIEVSKESDERYSITLQCKSNEKKIRLSAREGRVKKEFITNRVSIYVTDSRHASQLAKAFAHLISLCIASSATGELFEP